MDEIPSDLIIIVEEIIKKSEEILKEKLSTALIFTLSSHIYHSLKREEDIDKVDLPFDYSLDYLFPKEYEAADWAVSHLRDSHNINLPDSEKVFLTFHFVNAIQSSSSPKNIIDIGKIISDIVKIIEKNSSFLLEIDKESLYFSRFLIHIRYFLMKQNDERYKNQDEEKNKKFRELFSNMAIEFREAYYIVEKIKLLLDKQYNIICNDEESLYLLLHVQRLVEEAN